MKRQRAAFLKAQGGLRVERLVFLDETGTHLSMGHAWGWSKRGQPAVLTRAVRSKNMSLVGAIGLRGLRAAMVLEGGLDGPAFQVYQDSNLESKDFARLFATIYFRRKPHYDSI